MKTIKNFHRHEWHKLLLTFIAVLPFGVVHTIKNLIPKTPVAKKTIDNKNLKQSEDMIIKFTGIYTLEKDEFVILVKNNLHTDIIARLWEDGSAYTALFAIKLNLFLDFLENHINFDEMHQKHIPLENYFGAYIKKLHDQGAKIVYLKRIYDYLPIWTSHR